MTLSFQDDLPIPEPTPNIPRRRSVIRLEHLLWLPMIVYIVLFGVIIVTRYHSFDKDAMNYVEVARSIARGQGITQPAIGFNQVTLPPDAPVTPTPFTGQAPLYSVAIALVHLIGVDFPEAALIVAVVAYAWVIAMLTLIARALYGVTTGILALGGLCLYLAGRTVASAGWSEPLAVAFLVTSMYMLLQAVRRDRHRLPLLFIAGLMAGLSFATRYVLILLIPVELVFLLARRGSLRARLIEAFVCGLGAAAPVLFIVGRNLFLTHTLFPPSVPSTLGLIEATQIALMNLLNSYIVYIPEWETPQLVFALALGGLILLLALWSRRPLRFFRRVLIDRSRALLTLWALAYLVVLILWSTRSYFDVVRGRLLFPGGIVGVVLLAALVVAATRMSKGVAAVLALVMMGVVIYQMSQLFQTIPLYDSRRPIAASPRLTWIQQNTTTDDLIIGADAVDIPFYFDDRVVVSFSPYPYGNYITYEQVSAYACRYQDQFRYILLGLRRVPPDQLSNLYGPFLTDLVHRVEFPGFRVNGPLVLRDGVFYRLICTA